MEDLENFDAVIEDVVECFGVADGMQTILKAKLMNGGDVA